METTEYRLGDVCKLRNGYAFKSENFTSEGVPVIRISNIKDNEATVTKALKTNPSTVFEKFAVKKGDILIAMSGATTGKFGRYNSEVKAYQNQRVGCFVITDEEKISNDYLYLLLNGLKRKIESDAYGGGQPNISSTIIENYIVHLPSLKEQEKIVGVLNRAEQLVKERKKSILLFEEFLRSTFLKMFGQHNENLFPLEKLDDVATKITDGEHGKVNQIEKGRLYLMARNITVDNTIDLSEVSFISEQAHRKIFKRCNPQTGDLLLVCVGATIGKAVLVPENMEEFSIARSVALIKPDHEKLNSKYLLWFFKSAFGIRQVKDSSNEAAQAGLYTGKIKEIKIPLPPIALQNEFAVKVSKAEELKEDFKNSFKELENLLGSLTQRAFRGDLNIVERIEIKGSIKIQPKISAEVIAIDSMNKQLADFHNSIADSGAPIEIDNKLKQLDAELKLRGEIPFWDEYVKYRLIKEKQTTPFTFEKLWKEITAFPFESVPDYDTVKKMIFKLLNSDNPFLKQRFNESDKQIELLLNETTSA